MCLVNSRGNLALLSSIDRLVFEILALGTHAVRCIHALLELIVLPAENVVAVLSEAGVVAVAEVERLRAVGGPEALVVEWGSVPDNFVHELRDADGVSRGAAATETEEVGGPGGRVGDVGFVVWNIVSRQSLVPGYSFTGGVEVFAVPAAGMNVNRH